VTDPGPGARTAAAARHGTRPIWLVLQLLGVLIVTGALVVTVVHRPGTSHSPRTYAYTIPPGTGAAIERGEKIYVFPARLGARVGDQLVIHNNDSRVAEVGPYTVDRNATLVQTFTRPGTIVGICTIHPSGRVTIDVRR
jgi:hypothetical protein